MASVNDWAAKAAARRIAHDGYVHRWHVHADTTPPDPVTDALIERRIESIILEELAKVRHG